MNQRAPRVREKDYLGFIAALPCVACMVHGVRRRGVHVAHLRGGCLEHDKRPTGLGEKPSDRWATPLCPWHHVNGNRESQHYYPGGEEAFWADLGINPFAMCVALQADFDANRDGRTVIIRFAAAGRKALAA